MTKSSTHPHGMSLSSRLKLLTLLWVGIALFSIVFTLILSWRLEGAGAAINDAGSLRMQAYRMAYLNQVSPNPVNLRAAVSSFDHTLETIQHGDPDRPLFIPDNPDVQQRFNTVSHTWQLNIRPMLLQNHPPQKTQLAIFVSQIDHFVLAVETVNARNTEWLRLFQTALMALVLIGAAVMAVLLHLWVIAPINILRDGMHAIRNGDFGRQVQTGKVAEFAQLGDGFNRMSTHLASLYHDLEGQVNRQTHKLEQANHELQTLYQTTRALHQTYTPTDAAESFLEQILLDINADAGSIRLLDFNRKRMDLIASRGLPENIQTAEQCEHFEQCLCGNAACEPDVQPVKFYNTHTPTMFPNLCEKAGFEDIAVFQIIYQNNEIGILTLYFSDGHTLSHAETELIYALCSQLGVALTNIRLAEESRQLAVLQERNLMAQGLHDSIAQTLTFLNLQVQMLESALNAGENEQAEENLNLIKDGVQECYEDVRELLLNFRTKISKKEFPEAIQALVARFEQQTQIPIDIHWQGHGFPLSSDEQLQVIFILQESLSNIRKHAQAKTVQINIINEHDFILSVSDDGIGFDHSYLKKLSNEHVGMNIMKERARRIHAELDVQSTKQQGTTITLTLPHHMRTAT